jgi:hypothetical protein
LNLSSIFSNNGGRNRDPGVIDCEKRQYPFGAFLSLGAACARYNYMPRRFISCIAGCMAEQIHIHKFDGCENQKNDYRSHHRELYGDGSPTAELFVTAAPAITGKWIEPVQCGMRSFVGRTQCFVAEVDMRLYWKLSRPLHCFVSVRSTLGDSLQYHEKHWPAFHRRSHGNAGHLLQWRLCAYRVGSLRLQK